MEGSVLCMMNAVPLINKSGPYSSLTVRRRAITPTEKYGKVFFIQGYLYYDGCTVSFVQDISELSYVFVSQAELKQIRRALFGWGGYQDSAVELEQPDPDFLYPATGLPVPQQKCWGPGPWKRTSVCLLPCRRPTGQVQRGKLLR